MPRGDRRPRTAPSKPVPKFSFKARPESVITDSAPTGQALVHKAEENSRAAQQVPEPSAAPQAHPQHLSVRSRQQDESFTVDKRGDPLVRRYGSNNSREIPDYHRYGAGRVLGADGFIRFERTGTRTEFFFRGYRDKGPILSADRKTFRALNGLAGAQSIRVRQGRDQGTSSGAEYMSLHTSRNALDEAGQSRHASGSLHAGETPAYRSLEDKAGSESDDADGDRGHEKDLDSEMQSYNDDPVNSRSVELGRKVKADPTDMQAWYELVDHQDVLLRHTARDARHPTPAETKSFADIKLSLLEKAIKHAGTQTQREVAQSKLMAEGTKVWDRTTAIRRWEEVLQAYPHSQSLWQAQVEYRQADISTFRYDDIKQHYINRITYLRNAISKSDTSTSQLEMCHDLISTFLHATIFMSDAGFMELACSAWQAALELNFCRPTMISAEESSVALQEFWDSEVPRFGEPRSGGWATFANDPSQHEQLEPKNLGKRAPPPTRDAYKAWAATEGHRARQAATAARTLDEGAEDDPFRVVLYADIEHLLFLIPSSLVQELKPLLVNALLTFCALPPAFELRDSNSLVASWPQRRATGSSLASTRINATGSEGTGENDQRSPDFEQHFQAFVKTPETMSSRSSWFAGLETTKDSEMNARQLWVVNALKQLVHQCGEKDLAPYYLALNSVLAVADDKKTAKALLKQDPTNIELYLGYSSREHSKGDLMSASNIARATLTLPNLSEVDRVRLGIWILWLQLMSGQKTTATAEVLSMALSLRGESHPLVQQGDATQIHEATQIMMSRRDYSLSAGNLTHATVFSEALMLLKYLTHQSGKEPTSSQQGDICSALQSVDAYSEDLARRGRAEHVTHELLLQSAAKLLYFHASLGPCRLGLLRENFGKYIDFFPRNTVFQTLYAWRETRLSIDDRVRSKLDDIVSQPALDSLSTRAFMIQYEAHVGNVNSTVAAFQHALDNSNECKHHPQIWVAYIRYCYRHASLRGKAKGVFHRALQRCPWSKDLYMEAFTTLVSELDSSELRSVYNTMVEKGLRVHTEMEEFVQEWKAQQRDKRQRV